LNNAHHAIAVFKLGGFVREFIVDIWQEEGLWAAHNSELPLAAEAKSLPKLFAQAQIIAFEMAVLNGHLKEGETLKLKFIFEQEISTAA
jgi:Domain of unknown function (DUF1902)